MVGIVDYKMGNLHSVQKACAAVGLRSKIVTKADEIKKAKAIILPGVGAFGQAMAHLRQQRLIKALKETALSDKPFLGVCLGMQLLFESSEEFGTHAGLGIFKGKVKRFPKKLKVPHMGWNSLMMQKRSPFFKGVKEGSYMYFVHTYYCDPQDKDVLLATTAYGIEVAAAVGRGNICAMQFHPEKSQAIGLKVYHNLASLLKG